MGIGKKHWETSLDCREGLKREDSVFLVAEVQRRFGTGMAGYAVMRIHSWNQSGWLLKFATSSEWKRNGVAKALLEEIRKAVSKNGLRTMSIETQPDNMEAKEFYEAMGLRICGYNDRCYTNNHENAGETAPFYSMDIS